MSDPIVASLGWVVYVPQGSFTSVYGIFESYDAAIEWCRANGYDGETAHAHPIKHAQRSGTR